MRKNLIRLVTVVGTGLCLRSRILTARERQLIERYLKADGERISQVRVLAQRVRENLTQLRNDLMLLEKFDARYKRKNGTG